MTRALPFAALVFMGAGWGATQPLTIVAVSEGYRHFGLLFWQLVIGAVVLNLALFATGRRLPLGAAQIRLYLLIALIGTILPGIASYEAARHLPSGILSILLSAVPMLAFPVAMAMGLERFSGLRLSGLLLGLIGVALLVLPQTSLPEGTQNLWIAVALVSSAFYALEGNYVAKFGTCGLNPVQVLGGASVIGAIIVLPMALMSGHFIDPLAPWGAPNWALVSSAMLHAMVYSMYVWLVGRAGSVFAAQVSYFVTLFGVIWAMIFLGESYSGWVWAAMAVMLVGLACVQPRPTVARTGQAGQNVA